MTGKLLIDSKEIFLKPETVIAITLQVNDVGDVTNRQSNHSNAFQVRATQGNIAKLEYADKVPSQTNVPYRKLPAIYFQKGVQVIKNGLAVINQSAEEFEIVIYDGNVSFFNLIEGKKLSDLDLSDLDHVWNLTNILAYIPNTTGVIYPIVDYGNAHPYLRQVSAQYLLPWVFAHTIVERIFSSVGWTATGEILASDLWENLIISTDTLKQAERYLICDAFNGSPQTGTAKFLDFDVENADPQSEFVTGGAIQTESVTNVPGGSGDWWRYKAHGKGKYSFYFNINYTTDVEAGRIVIYLRKVGEPNLYIVFESPAFLQNVTDTWEETIEGLSMEDGEALYVFYRTGNAVSGTITINPGSIFQCIAATAEVSYDHIFPIAENVSSITQKDFLKSLFQMLCIIPIANSVTQEVAFIQFDDIVFNKYKAIDWTEKMDMGTKAKLVYNIGNYAQVNYMRYKADETVEKEHGDGSFEIDDTSLSNVVTLVTLPFAATEDITTLFGLSVPLYERTIGLGRIEEGSSRILILDRETLTDLITYTDGITSETPVGDAPLCYFAIEGKADNLKFSDNLLEKHYTNFIAMLNNLKKVICPMKLSAIDIETLDFTIPVYLKQYGACFYVNKISQWIDNATICEAELVKLP